MTDTIEVVTTAVYQNVTADSDRVKLCAAIFSAISSFDFEVHEVYIRELKPFDDSKYTLVSACELALSVNGYRVEVS